MDWAGRRRVYRETAVAVVEGGFAVALDGRSVRTPAGHLLVVPTRVLAQAIADEWDAQVNTVRPEIMPMASLAVSAIDRVGPARGKIVSMISAYVGTDLVCYRAEMPKELARRQESAWQPLLDWAADVYGAHLVVTTGILPVKQPPDAVASLTAVFEELDDFTLAALLRATQTCGSLVVGLALIQERIDADSAFAASFVDEDFQIEKWGEDAEAMARRAALRADVETAERFLLFLAD